MAGCAGAEIAPATSPAATVAVAPIPKPRNADVIAAAIAQGKTSVSLYPTRGMGHPLPRRLLGMAHVTELFEGTGLDPIADVERAFVSAPSIRSRGEEVSVIEHNLSADRLKSAMDLAIVRSEPAGSYRDDLDMPAITVTIRGQTRVVAEVSPTVLVVLPEARAREASRFIGTGGLPDPVGDELLRAVAIDPASTLRHRRGPAIPPTLSLATLTLKLTPGGGTQIDLTAQSASEAQAGADARSLTEQIDALTSVKLGFVRVRLFEPVLFKPDGDRVTSKVILSGSEVDRLLGMASAFLPGT